MSRYIRREFMLGVAAAAFGLTVLAGDAAAQNKIRIGFSQSTTSEPWRVQFNKDMRREAEKHPEIDLVIADGQDRTDKQVADVENFIRQKMDVLLISPKETAGLTGVVNKAVDAGIPVIVLDRGVDTDRYTQFIGGDNRMIGEMVGKYIVDLLGGPGKAQGNVVEIWGGMGSTPAQERHAGYAAHVDKESGIKQLLNRQDGDWKQDKAYNIMATALKANPKIDVVYGHNDPMAYGAYLAAKDAGREKDIKFIGIDAIPNEGALWVKRGFLTATFVYKTPGADAIQQALKLVKGEKIEKKLTLDTALVDSKNVDAVLKENGVSF
jgi:ribose transport system substrate-binding protein